MADNLDALLGIVPEAFVRGAGLVVTQWAWSETLLDQFIWRMLGVRAMRGRIITANLTARGKIHILAALMRKSRWDENIISSIEGEGKALSELRNLIAHGAIAVPPNGTAMGTVTSYTARGELTPRTRLITAEILYKAARRFAAFNQLLIEVSAKLPKQRGLRTSQGSESQKPRRLRIETILRRLPPPLEVERPTRTSHQEMEAARAAKRAQRAAHRKKSASDWKSARERSQAS